MEKESRLKTNMGLVDRMVRLCAGIALIVLGSLVVEGTIGVILLVLGVIAVVTSAIGFCPGYVPFGISTAGSPGAEFMSTMMTRCRQGSGGFSGCCNMEGRNNEAGNPGS